MASMKSASLHRPMPAFWSGVMFGPKNVPNGVFKSRPPAKGVAPCFASVWQPTQPAAVARYWPRFASPWARAPCSAAKNSSAKSKSPAAAGLVRECGVLLLLAEVLVAAAAGLADSADLRLHGALVAALGDLGELGRFAQVSKSGDEGAVKAAVG